MSNSKILISSITALMICGSSLSAQELKMNTVDVWETEVSSSSINLGKDSIETKQANHLSDLLKDIPGVDVGGTHSINNRINIRGVMDEDLDITIDGAKVANSNMFHHIGNLLINPDILKKADIQVGTNSVVRGSLGGSVAFVTKDGRDMLEKGRSYGARLQANYSSNKSYGGSITGFGKVGESFDFLIYNNYVQNKDWKDGRGVKTFGAEGKVRNTLLKLSTKINDTNRISISYDKVVDKGDYSPRPDFGRDYVIKDTGNTKFPTQYDRDTITLKHELDLGENLRVDTSIYSNKNELERIEDWTIKGRSPRPSLVGLLNGEVETFGLNSKAQSSFDIGSSFNTFTYGVIYDKQTSEVSWNSSKYGQDEEAKTIAVYLEDAIEFSNGFILTPGIRYNHYDFDGSYGKINDREITYGLSAEYPITEDFTLLASATTLYKGVPMVDVLASDRTSTKENQNLKSETGINKEVGFKYIKENILGADDIGFSFKYFNTLVKDHISADWKEVNGVWNNYMSNAGELEYKGFESSFAYNKNAFESLVTYSKSDSKYKSTGLPTTKDPGDTLSVNLKYKYSKNLKFSWTSLFAFKEKDVASSTYNEKDSYNVHDIALNWKPKAIKGLSVIAGVDNIFDKEYISHISENRTIRGTNTADFEAGRNMKLTLAYKF